MIQEIIQKWETNKSKLEQKFKTHKAHSGLSYETIVKYIFEIVINDSDDDYGNYDVSKMTVIDDGSYQGTQIFIIPKSTYQPSVEDYLLTHTYYGSCSGCDTLEAILSDYNWDDEIEYDNQVFNEKQVSELMTLSLHLVQKMKVLGSGE